MDRKVLNLTGVENVTAKLVVVPSVTSMLAVEISDIRVVELRDVLSRGLNTWGNAPRWLLELCDMAEVGAAEVLAINCK